MIPAQFIQERAIPETDHMFTDFASAVSMSDPAGAEAAENLGENAQAAGMLLRVCDVSLERVAGAMAECIKKTGTAAVDKAYASCESKNQRQK